MEYTTKAAVQNYLLTQIDESFDGQFDEWNEGISRHIDQLVGLLVCSEEESTFKYDGNGRRTMFVAPVRDISSVTIGEQTVEVVAYPANRDVKHELRLRTLTYFTPGMQNVEVTGIHALFAAVPSDIKFAATVLVAGIIRTSKGEGDQVTSEKVGNYSVSYASEKERDDFKRAMAIINSHKRLSF